MSKNVTEFGKEIADILRDTPYSLQDLQSLIDWYFNFPGDLTPPHHGGKLPRLASDGYAIGQLYAGQGRTNQGRL